MTTPLKIVDIKIMADDRKDTFQVDIRLDGCCSGFTADIVRDVNGEMGVYFCDSNQMSVRQYAAHCLLSELRRRGVPMGGNDK